MVPKPEVISRKDWGAKPPTRGYTSIGGYCRYDGLSVHHAADYVWKQDGSASIDEDIAYVQGMQRYHQNSVGATDIFSSFVICASGRIFEGRPLDVMVGITYARPYNAGCEHQGNTMLVPFSKKEWDSSVKLYAYLFQECQFSINLLTDLIKTHRMYYPPGSPNATACAGDIMQSQLLEYHKQVKQLLLPSQQPRRVKKLFYEQTRSDHTITEHGGPNEFQHLWLNVGNPNSATITVVLRTKSKDGKKQLFYDEKTISPLGIDGWDLKGIPKEVPGIIQVQHKVANNAEFAVSLRPE